jgi:hypothetical protein
MSEEKKAPAAKKPRAPKKVKLIKAVILIDKEGEGVREELVKEFGSCLGKGSRMLIEKDVSTVLCFELVMKNTELKRLKDFLREQRKKLDIAPIRLDVSETESELL